MRQARRFGMHRQSRAAAACVPFATPQRDFSPFVAIRVRSGGRTDKMAQSIILPAAPRAIRRPALPEKEHP